MRLNQYLSHAGVCSRREAEKLIESGKVSINGTIVKPPAPLVTEKDTVSVDGKNISLLKAEKVWIFYKPLGLITTHDDEKNRPTVFNHLKNHGLQERIISVGRLDINSEGLLLLTNSPTFAKFAESPKTAWKRIYRIRVFGNIRSLNIPKLAKGITIDGIHYKGIDIELEKESSSGRNAWLRLTLYEGKNREIRKIMEHFNLQVNRLIRFQYGPYSLENLKPGEFKLTPPQEDFKPKP